MSRNHSTRDVIMDVAEVCFGDQGIAVTSIRDIVKKADVNLGAVNYHFGTKENLVLEVLIRRLDPLIAKKLQNVKELKSNCQQRPLPLPELIRAYALPQLEQIQQCPQFVRFMMRLRAYESSDVDAILEDRFSNRMKALHEELKAAMPLMSDAEFHLRIYMSIWLLHVNPLTDMAFRRRLAELKGDVDPIRTIMSFIERGLTAPVEAS